MGNFYTEKMHKRISRDLGKYTNGIHIYCSTPVEGYVKVGQTSWSPHKKAELMQTYSPVPLLISWNAVSLLGDSIYHSFLKHLGFSGGGGGTEWYRETPQKILEAIRSEFPGYFKLTS